MKKTLAVIITVLILVLSLVSVFAAVGEISVYVNDIRVEFDQPPVTRNDRTLVPLRAIFEALDAEVDWDDATQTVTSVRGNTTVTLTINSNKMYVDGVEKVLDVSPILLNSRTLVPVRAISEAFGCDVDWDEETQTVYVTEAVVWNSVAEYVDYVSQSEEVQQMVDSYKQMGIDIKIVARGNDLVYMYVINADDDVIKSNIEQQTDALKIAVSELRKEIPLVDNVIYEYYNESGELIASSVFKKDDAYDDQSLLETYIDVIASSDEFKSLAAQYELEGMKLSLFARGNDMVYRFDMDFTFTDSEIAELRAIFEEEIDAGSLEGVLGPLKQALPMVENVVVEYYTKDGKLIFSIAE